MRKRGREGEMVRERGREINGGGRVGGRETGREGEREGSMMYFGV